MDIIIRANQPEYHSYFERVISEGLNTVFKKHRYIDSVRVHLDTPSGETKHVRLRTRLFGKELLVEASDMSFKKAVEEAIQKLKWRVRRYKDRRFNS